MLKSMTGFGVAEAEQGGYKVAVELRSVNHRFLDIAVRLPRTLLEFEDTLKSRVRERIDRGRVSLTLTFEAQSGAEKLELNQALVQAYVEAGQKIASNLGFDGDLLRDSATVGPLLATMLAQPEIMTRTAQEIDKKQLGVLLLDCLERAITQADEMKTREGKTLGEDLGKRLDLLQGSLDNIEKLAPLVPENARKTLQTRLAKLLDAGEVDETRLAQEVAILVDRCDITEECVRLASHLGQFRSTMASSEQGARRMGFLLQEMHREANTIASKANDLEMGHASVAIREEIERLREQLENVE